jgi:Uma2 family endonuclease
VVKKELARYWYPLAIAHGLDVVTETTLRYGGDTFLEPDFIFWPRSIPLRDISCPTALLIVEVADSSLTYDTGRKAQIYGGLGLREYWVVDANALAVRVHAGPANGQFASVRTCERSELIVPALAPELAMRLADLDLERLIGE